MNKHDFHIPFIKSLVVTGLVTLGLMVFSHYYIPRLILLLHNSSEFTVSQSYNEAKASD